MIGFLTYGVVIFFAPVWSNIYGLTTASAVMALFAIVYTIAYGKKIVIVSTITAGAYIFMRGWSLIFTGFNHEIVVWQTLYSGEEFETKWPFLVYTLIFNLSFGIFAIIQSINSKDHAQVKRAFDEET